MPKQWHLTESKNNQNVKEISLMISDMVADLQTNTHP
jgi:hypothetical protein